MDEDVLRYKMPANVPFCCMQEGRRSWTQTMKARQALGGRRGFTLLELLIAVAVVGLLAAVAYPSYTAYVRRGKIAAALGELSAVRVRLEQYYQDNRNYGSTATACGVPMPSAPAFQFSCNWGPGGTSQSFLVTATGQASGGMAGYAYTVDQADQQKTVQFDGAAVDAGCWVKKQGEAC
jgi:type IV pilus assembly protein PilE